MSDSDWRDPFADDDAARERAERRAARERRRREEDARESLGERVEESLGADRAAEAPRAPVPQPESTPAPEPQPEPPSQPEPDPEPDPPASSSSSKRFETADYAAPDLPPRKPPAPAKSAVRRRRALALLAIGIIIAAVAGVGAYLANRGDDEPVVSQAPAPRRTMELVIPEGFTRDQVAEVVKEAGIKGDYVKATKSAKGFGLEKYGVSNSDSLEGFLFPATYEVFRDSKVDGLVKKQVEAFEVNLGEVDVAAAKKNGYDIRDVVVIASMVEREIAVGEERDLASSVIYNRLDNGTPLGIDATIRFEDKNYSGQILQSRLEADTPYNTRINAGLPPGPIGNPGLASLQAAAKPADTEFFYFVIKPGSCNEHTFVETEAEFAAAEADYQAALQAEGGSPTEC